MNSTGKRIITAEAIAAFGRYLQNEEKGRSTQEYYLRTARRLMEWLGGQTVEKAATIAYKESLKARGYKTGSINTMLAAMNSFLRFLGWEDCRVKSLREQAQDCDTKGRELQREDFERLVDAAEAAENRRLALLLNAMSATGMRVSELKFITVEAALLGMTVVTLKGKSRHVVLSGGISTMLLKYAEEQGIETGPIFITRTGRPMSRTNIWREMKALSVRAKVPEHKVFPHNLRHYFARAFYNLNHDIVKLSVMLGHSSIDTTRRYIKSTIAEFREQLDRMDMVYSGKMREKKTA